jgi:hypothetical protein
VSDGFALKQVFASGANEWTKLMIFSNNSNLGFGSLNPAPITTQLQGLPEAIDDSDNLSRAAEVAYEFSVRRWGSSDFYTKNAPAALRIFDTFCKTTFATLSRAIADMETFHNKGSAQQCPLSRFSDHIRVRASSGFWSDWDIRLVSRLRPLDRLDDVGRHDHGAYWQKTGERTASGFGKLAQSQPDFRYSPISALLIAENSSAR